LDYKEGVESTSQLVSSECFKCHGMQVSTRKIYAPVTAMQRKPIPASSRIHFPDEY
jgi:hypothetical protein